MPKIWAILVLFGLSIGFGLPAFANTPYLRGAFLKVEGVQVKNYLIKVHYENSEAGKDYEYPVNLEDGKIYIHPRPTGDKSIITVEPVAEDFVARSVYSISNQDLLQKWYSAEGKDYFDAHDFKLEGKNGVSIESLSDSPDLFVPESECEEFRDSSKLPQDSFIKDRIDDIGLPEPDKN